MNHDLDSETVDPGLASVAGGVLADCGARMTRETAFVVVMAMLLVELLCTGFASARFFVTQDPVWLFCAGLAFAAACYIGSRIKELRHDG